MSDRKNHDKVSVRDAVAAAGREHKKLPQERAAGGISIVTQDSFQNFASKMGVGTDNQMSGSTYGYNPITKNRTLLEWIHRGSWLGGVAVDLVANDMTRAGIEIRGKLDPADIAKIESEIGTQGVWKKLNEAIRWGRLYGGAIAVMLIDGQEMKTPLRIETVGKGAFKGLFVLDRWMLDPVLEDLVTDMGPDLGMPKFYRVNASAAALRGVVVHHSRVMRFEGVVVPYQQRLNENLWTISVLERLYDRLIAYDSATTGAAQLVYKSYLRTLAIESLRDLIALGGSALDGLVQYVQTMARFQSIEGITVIDKNDEFKESSHSAFGGLRDILTQFGEQLAGALQIPVSRLFGKQVGGLGSSGDSDERTYYDSVKQEQQLSMGISMLNLVRVIAQSLSIKLPSDFKIEFRSLWQLTDDQKASIASQNGSTVAKAFEDAIIDRATALKELRQSSHTTGTFSNITDEDIEIAESEPVMPTGEEPDAEDDEPPAAAPKSKKGVPSKDSGLNSIVQAYKHLGLQVVIENPRGSNRQGIDPRTGGRWNSVMPDDYGFVRGATGADGDQVDCFVGPFVGSSDTVYVVDQRDLYSRAFDEHKCMLGYPSRELAIATYNAAFHDGRGPERIGSVSEMNIAQFAQWLKSADLKKPSSAWFGKKEAA